MKTWVLCDDRVGSYKQSISIATKCGLDFQTIKVEYNKLASLPNIVKGKTSIGISKKTLQELPSEAPEVIISAGRKLSPFALFLKKKFNDKPFLINIFKPDLAYSNFDLVLLPQHDKQPKDRKNIVNFFGSLNGINEDFLKEQTNEWSDYFKKYKSPKIALLVGGGSKKGKFTEEMAEELSSYIVNVQKNMNASVLITNSRRTSKEAIGKIKKNLSNDEVYFYDWQLHTDIKNPYFGFLAVADFIVVTGDSLSMCAEACSTGKPVYIYAPDDICSDKHKKMHNELFEKNIAKKIDTKNSEEAVLEKYNYSALRELDRISGIIKEKLGL